MVACGGFIATNFALTPSFSQGLVLNSDDSVFAVHAGGLFGVALYGDERVTAERQMPSAAGVVPNRDVHNVTAKLGSRHYDQKVFLDMEHSFLRSAYHAGGVVFPRRLEGDFSVALIDRGLQKMILSTDAFGTHALFVANDGAGRFAAATSRQACAHVGFQDHEVQRIPRNTILELEWHQDLDRQERHIPSTPRCFMKLMRSREVFAFDLHGRRLEASYGASGDAWEKAFRVAVTKRTRWFHEVISTSSTTASHRILVSLSDGSSNGGGAVHAALLQQQAPHVAIALGTTGALASGDEGLAHLESLHQYVLRSPPKSERQLLLLAHSSETFLEEERWLWRKCEPLEYPRTRGNVRWNIQDPFAPHLSAALRQGTLRGCFVHLSGVGAELHHAILQSVAHQSSVVASLSNELLLTGAVAAAHGMSVRYPLLDPRVVQESVWFGQVHDGTDLREPIVAYLVRHGYPQCWQAPQTADARVNPAHSLRSLLAAHRVGILSVLVSDGANDTKMKRLESVRLAYSCRHKHLARGFLRRVLSMRHQRHACWVHEGPDEPRAMWATLRARAERNSLEVIRREQFLHHCETGDVDAAVRDLCACQAPMVAHAKETASDEFAQTRFRGACLSSFLLARGPSGHTCLHWASGAGHLAVASAVLELTSRPSAGSKLHPEARCGSLSNQGDSPLALAFYRNDTEMWRLFLAHGAKLDSASPVPPPLWQWALPEVRPKHVVPEHKPTFWGRAVGLARLLAAQEDEQTLHALESSMRRAGLLPPRASKSCHTMGSQPATEAHASTPRIWLLVSLCADDESSVTLFPHFHAHYTDSGVLPQHFLVVLHSDGTGSEGRFRLAEEWLREHFNVSTIIRATGPYSSKKLYAVRVRALAEHVAFADWVVQADVDEFHAPLGPNAAGGFAKMLKSADAEGADVVFGAFVDRAAADGSLASVPPDGAPASLFAAFSLNCALTALLQEGDIRKIVAYRGYLRSTPGNHDALCRLAPTSENLIEAARVNAAGLQTVADDCLGGNLSLLGEAYELAFQTGHVPACQAYTGVTTVYHLRWTAGLDQRLRRRVRQLAQMRLWTAPSQTVLDHLSENHGHLGVQEFCQPAVTTGGGSMPSGFSAEELYRFYSGSAPSLAADLTTLRKKHPGTDEQFFTELLHNYLKTSHPFDASRAVSCELEGTLWSWRDPYNAARAGVVEFLPSGALRQYQGCPTGSDCKWELRRIGQAISHVSLEIAGSTWKLVLDPGTAMNPCTAATAVQEAPNDAPREVAEMLLKFVGPADEFALPTSAREQRVPLLVGTVTKGSMLTSTGTWLGTADPQPSLDIAKGVTFLSGLCFTSPGRILRLRIHSQKKTWSGLQLHVWRPLAPQGHIENYEALHEEYRWSPEASWQLVSASGLLRAEVFPGIEGSPGLLEVDFSAASSARHAAGGGPLRAQPGECLGWYQREGIIPFAADGNDIRPLRFLRAKDDNLAVPRGGEARTFPEAALRAYSISVFFAPEDA